MLHLFSAKPELLTYGAQHYRIRSRESSNLLFRLFERFQKEGELMPDLLEEFTRQSIAELLRELPVEKRLEGLTADQIARALPAETLRALADKFKEQESSDSKE